MRHGGEPGAALDGQGAAGKPSAPRPPGGTAEAVLWAEATERIQVYLEHAAAAVCQYHLELWRYPKERLKAAGTRAYGPDLSCHAPCTIWRRLAAQTNARQRAQKGAACEATPPGNAPARVGHLAPIVIETISEYGLKRAVTYSCAADLTRAILSELPTEARQAIASTHVRDSDGMLFVTTRLQLAKQRASGRLQCVQCGDFCAEGRGLRDHIQVKHKHGYDVAISAVGEARGAIVARAPDGSVSAMLCHMWEVQSAMARVEKKSLPHLLVLARYGDSNALVHEVAVAVGLAGTQHCACASGTLSGGLEADCMLDLITRDDNRVARAADYLRGTTDKYGSTALHWAAGAGHINVLAVLLRLGIDVGDTGRQKDGRTALHWAARNGHLTACRWLVSKGADPNATTHDGTSPLHWAVWRGELDVSRYLVDEAGADLHATNAYGCNAIQWAAQSDTGELKMCQWLRDRGLDLHLLNRNGHSALHKAAVKGNVATCEWLLAAHGGGLGIRHLQGDQDGNTPSRMARFEGFVELAQALEKYEAEAVAS